VSAELGLALEPLRCELHALRALLESRPCLTGPRARRHPLAAGVRGKVSDADEAQAGSAGGGV
jgi:hypothetical protein